MTLILIGAIIVALGNVLHGLDRITQGHNVLWAGTFFLIAVFGVLQGYSAWRRAIGG